jgi:hypothetical protein
MKVTIFVKQSDNFFKIFKIFLTRFPIKFSKSLLKGHFCYLASNLPGLHDMHVKYKH